MATLDEVISQMSEEDYFSDSIQFIIDSDLRIVSIPDRGVVAGVVGDKNVNRINFQMPRYYNGFDMSKFTTKVNYINANSNINYYTVTDLTVENDTILFTWLIDSDAVAYAGTVMFSVNMFIADGNGKITQAFNTSNKGKMTVLEGIQVNEYVTPEAQEDILTRLEADLTKCVSSGISQINTVTSESIQKIQVESTKATDSISAGLSKIATRTDESVKKVQDEGKKVKASIPTDYTELTETVSDLETQSSNLDYEVNSRLKQFYKYSKGATEINDSDNGRIHNLKVYGRSEQKQYSGKNLLNPTFKTDTHSGVTLTNNGDGTYTIEGTNNSSGELIFSLVLTVDEQKALYNSLIGKNVKFITESGSTISGSVGRICFVFYNKTENRFSNEIHNGGNVTVPTGYDLSVVDIHINVGQTVSKTIIKPMITTDLTATYDDFEPYTGGQPSPSPDYPQEIKSVVNPTVKVCGKNLLKATLQTATVNGVTCTNNGDGTYTLNGTASGGNPSFRIGKIIAKSGRKLVGSPGAAGSYVSYLPNGTWNNVTEEKGDGSIISNIGKGTDEIAIVVLNGTTVKNLLFKPMLTTDLTATYDDFEPYHEQTVTLPYDLYGVKVPSGGNVTIDGQEYVSDYFDVERGKLVRMVYDVEAKNYEWHLYSATVNTPRRFGMNDTIGLDMPDDTRIMSFHFKQIAYGAGTDLSVWFQRFYIAITDMNEKWENSEALIQWFSENNVHFYLPLKTPIEIDLTPEEVQAFKAFETYYPTTNISINSEQLDGYTVFNYPIPFEDEWIKTKKDVDSLKEDLANLENTLELPKDIYVLEPSDIQSGYIIDSNGTIRTNEKCTLYKYDVTNINSVYISHRGAASMPVYWLEKNVLISHFTAEYDTWSGKVDTSNADTLYLNMISIYTPVVSCLVEGKRVPGYGKSYVDLQGKSSGHFYLINSESGCFSQQETTDSQYATYYPIFLKAGKYRFNSAVSTTFSIIVKNDEISHLNFTENKLNIVEFDTDVTLYPTSTRGRDAVICDASIDILSVSDKGLFPICNPIYVGNKMDFSTIKEATTYISDSSKEKEYNIYIEKGTYNESSITLPDYVNLIGLSNEKESVWVKGELPDNALDTEITPNSTINISMNNKFKNITVSAKNLRYSVHDESNNKQKNWNQRFDNCKFIHYGTYGAKSYREEHSLDTSNLWTSCHAWGEGASDGSFIEFNDCIFESVENGYYVHEGISQSEPYKRIFNNCEFIMIDTVNIHQKWNNSISIDNTRDITAKNILLFNNCFISDSMRINGTIPIDVRLSGCGIVPIRANMNTDMYPLNTECMDDCYYVGDTPLVGGEVLAITNRHNQVVIANENTQKELICGVAVGTVNKYGYVRVMKKGYISLAGKNGILYTVGENGQIANATNESKLIIGVCVGQFVKLLID